MVTLLMRPTWAKTQRNNIQKFKDQPHTSVILKKFTFFPIISFSELWIQAIIVQTEQNHQKHRYITSDNYSNKSAIYSTNDCP